MLQLGIPSKTFVEAKKKNSKLSKLETLKKEEKIEELVSLEEEEEKKEDWKVSDPQKPFSVARIMIDSSEMAV